MLHLLEETKLYGKHPIISYSLCLIVCVCFTISIITQCIAIIVAYKIVFMKFQWIAVNV